MNKLTSILSTLALLLLSGLASGTARAASLSAGQQHYLTLALTGVARAEQRFGNDRLGWYDARLDDRERYPLATIWDIVPLFQSLDAIAIAQPTQANRRAVARFAKGAERYLNRGLRPVPGYSPYPGDREADTETWFDDNGWWGLAFDTLLATLIYQQTHSRFALAQALKFLAWGNTEGFSTADGLYAGSSLNPTPIDYIEGPLIYAQALLCTETATPSDCQWAEQLKGTALRRFGQTLDFSPQYDAIYLQWMLALYSIDHDSALYALAAENAREAQTHALNGEGLYLLSWKGETLPAQDAEPGMLQTQAATTSLFAWLAVYPPPA